MSKRLFDKKLNRIYAMNFIKIRFIVFRKVFELCKINVFFVNPLRWYWGRKSNCFSIKFLKNTVNESLPRKIVSEKLNVQRRRWFLNFCRLIVNCGGNSVLNFVSYNCCFWLWNIEVSAANIELLRLLTNELFQIIDKKVIRQK